MFKELNWLGFRELVVSSAIFTSSALKFNKVSSALAEKNETERAWSYNCVESKRGKCGDVQSGVWRGLMVSRLTLQKTQSQLPRTQWQERRNLMFLETAVPNLFFAPRTD